MSDSKIIWETNGYIHFGRLPTDRRHKYEFSYVIQRGSKGEYILRDHIDNFSDLESAKTHAEELERNK